MIDRQDEKFHKGYVMGYRDAIADMKSGKLPAIKEEFADYPIRNLDLSSRAVNCLIMNGCKYVSDVADLSPERIATMRKLGPKTAAEIAHWLERYGICCSAWCAYL